jgi:hypothetical protein
VQTLVDDVEPGCRRETGHAHGHRSNEDDAPQLPQAPQKLDARPDLPAPHRRLVRPTVRLLIHTPAVNDIAVLPKPATSETPTNSAALRSLQTAGMRASS